VTACLENLERSANLKHVGEMSGKKSCHGKMSQNCSLLVEYDIHDGINSNDVSDKNSDDVMFVYIAGIYIINLKMTTTRR